MCSNCEGYPRCDCSGAAVLAVCGCERGYVCPMCGHVPDISATSEPDLLVEILRPEMIVDVE